MINQQVPGTLWRGISQQQQHHQPVWEVGTEQEIEVVPPGGSREVESGQAYYYDSLGLGRSLVTTPVRAVGLEPPAGSISNHGRQ